METEVLWVCRWLLGKSLTSLGKHNPRVTAVLIHCPRVSAWTQKEILMIQFLSKTWRMTHIAECCREYRDTGGRTQLMCCCWWLDGWLFWQHLLRLDSDVRSFASAGMILEEDVTNCHGCLPDLFINFVYLGVLLTFWASFPNQKAAILVFGCQKYDVLYDGIFYILEVF